MATGSRAPGDLLRQLEKEEAVCSRHPKCSFEVVVLLKEVLIIEELGAVKGRVPPPPITKSP